MRTRWFLLSMALAGVVLAAFSVLGWAAPGDLELVSQTSGGVTGNGTSRQPDISPTGQFVAFLSNAANLGAGGHFQAYLRDRAAGTTTLVSVAPDGTTPANADVDSATVSDDGTHVAFHTRATNVVAGATTAGVDRSYVRDLPGAATTLVTAAADDGAVNPAISGDGANVAFASHAHYDGLNSASLETYVRDVGAATIHAVSVGMTVADQPAISQSGRFVAVRGQQNGVVGVWVRDRTAGTTTLVSRRSGVAGAAGSSASDQPAITADGRFVTFRSGAENLSDDDDPAHQNQDVYERDTAQSTTTLVSRADGASGDAVGSPDASGSGSPSDDGRRVLFVSSADGLASVAGNGDNVYLRDLDAGTTTLVSAKADGTTPPQGLVDGASMAGQGLYAAFATNAALQSGVSGTQVYRREFGTPPAPPAPPSVSIGDAPTVIEGDPGGVTQAVFPVTLDHASAKPVTVAWNTQDGSATAGADYSAGSGQVVIDPGHTAAAVAVDVLGDSEFEGDETFQVALHDPANAVLDRTAGSATIANDDAQPAPAPPGPGPGPGPGPSGLPATTGAPVADCPTRIVRGQAHLTGCFNGDTARGRVTVNGLLLTPLSPATTITATASKISSSGPVAVTAGEVSVSRGALDLNPTAKPAGVLTPATGSSVYGLDLEPRVGLSWRAGGGVSLIGRVSPRFGTILGTPLDVTMSADEASGLHRDQLAAAAPTSLVGRLLVTDLRFRFVPAENRWAGSITFMSPIFDALKVAAHIPNATRIVTGAGGLTNATVRSVVTVRRLDLQLLANPLRVEGNIDAVAGPPVAGQYLLGLTGTVRDDLSTARLTVGGTASVYGLAVTVPKIVLFGGAPGAFGDPPTHLKLFEIGGRLATKLPSGADAKVEVDNASLNVAGGALRNAHGLAGFYLSGEGEGSMKVLGVPLSGHFFFTDKAYGACGQIGPLNTGFAVTNNPRKVEMMGPLVCDIGPWKAAASAAQAGGVRTIHLAKGRALLRLTGDTAPPQVVMSGPGGRTVTVPAADRGPLVTGAVAILRDPAARTTYIGLADGGGGNWTITPVPGSARITKVDGATILPRPKVSGKVTGRGPTRTLRWSAGGPAGQHLIFEERGATGVLQRLGEKQGRGGTIHFTPAPGSGRRTLTALVLQGGHPRALLTVARFQAPRSAASGRVGSLTVTLSGRTTRLRWSGVKGAARYLVVVRTASGPVARLAGARARSLTVTDVATVKSATATITALDASGRRGPPRQASARAGRR